MLPIKIQLPEQFFHEETRCDFKITAQTKRLWAVLLDLLCEFDRVCRKYDIQYALDSGTLLGAVRHKGFIPWDDDMDVIMLRSEYDRLCKVASDEFRHPYFWQNNETDPGSVRRHAQLRNSATTAILKDEMKEGKPLFSFNQGVFLDVFILDEIPDRQEEMAALRAELSMHISVLWELKQMFFANDRLSWIQDALMQEARHFDALVSQYTGSGCRRVANFSLNPNRKESTLFDRNLFSELTDYEFEGFAFPGPKNSNTVLTGYYGDWHEWVVGNTMHGGLLLDLEMPYTEYLADGASVLREERKDKIHILAELICQRNTAWQDLERTNQALSKALQDCELERQEKDSMLHSRSWRITKPLRWLERKKKKNGKH